jgi:hypothetical protein
MNRKRRKELKMRQRRLDKRIQTIQNRLLNHFDDIYWMPIESRAQFKGINSIWETPLPKLTDDHIINIINNFNRNLRQKMTVVNPYLHMSMPTGVQFGNGNTFSLIENTGARGYTYCPINDDGTMLELY